MKKYRLIIFDLDGTLADTSQGILECHKFTNTAMGRPEPTDKELEGIIGGPLLETYRTRFGFPDEEARRAVEIYRRRYAEKGIYGAKAYNGMRDTLTELKNRGLRLAVATLKADTLAKQLLRDLDMADSFDVIHGVDPSDTVTKSDLIEFCINDTGIRKDEAVLVGDSIHDYKGAEKSGVDFIAALYGFDFKTANDLIGINHAAAINRPDELLEICGMP